MDGRRVLLAVSGGIAAYKVPELVRGLRRAGHSVRCALTPEAHHFVAPLSLQTVSGEAVRSDLFDPAQEGEIDHIALADWAEAVVVAPATANLLAKLAGGPRDDLVSTLLLATRAPVLVAPAMNVNMWRHPATQANVATLRGRGVRFVGPASGELACGWEGEGRMAEPAEIQGALELLLGAPDPRRRARGGQRRRHAGAHRLGAGARQPVLGQDGLRDRGRGRAPGRGGGAGRGAAARSRRRRTCAASTSRARSRCAPRCSRSSRRRRWW